MNFFELYSNKDPVAIIELLDKERKPIAALYMAELKNRDPSKIFITETNSSLDEKYYLYLDGVGIYFTYHRPLKNNK